MALNGDPGPGFKLETLIARFTRAPALGLAGRFAVTAAAMGVAMLLRAGVSWMAPNVGVSQTFFVAIIIATLFCGLGWGAATLLVGAVVSMWFWSGQGAHSISPNQQAGLVMYLISGFCVALVAAALRATMVRVNEAQSARRVSEARLGLTQSAGGVGLWEWNALTDELYWSPAFRINMGIPLDAPAVPQIFIDHLHPDDRDRVVAVMNAGRDGQESYELDYRPAPRAGEVERWLHERGESVFENGRLVRMVGINFDVTDQHRAAEDLRESEARFRTLADAAPALMWVSRLGGQREFVNQAYADFLNTSKDEATSFDWRERLHPDDLTRVLRDQTAGETSLKPFTLEARYLNAQGEYRWVKSFSRPRISEAGEFKGYIGMAVDVTEAKQAQADLTRINELLAERVAEALAERDAAQEALMQSQKLEAVGQLTGGVAHDFNNLLTVVIGALDILEKNPQDDARRARLIDAALQAARRGERLTQQLLAFSRRQSLRPEVVDPDVLINGVQPLLRRVVDETITLQTDLAGEGCVVRLDVGQFEAALVNLVVNARDAAPSGTVQVSTRCVRHMGEPRLDVCVQDDGAGMDADTVARAFEPFFTTKPVGKGTGLGLSQVYGFAKQSGGEVVIDSAPERGTRVTLRLPLAQGEAQAPAPKPQPPAGPTRPMTVLLVEDDPSVGDVVETMLVELGHEVVRADCAAPALKIATSNPRIGLVLTDVIMPGGVSGVDLALDLSRKRPGLPIVLSSGYTGEALTRAEATPWPLLRKPYNIETLAGALRDAAENPQALIGDRAAPSPGPIA